MRIPREASSDLGLWARLRAAARKVGAQAAFPDQVSGAVTRRPHAVPAPRRAGDRPDRLHVRVLAQDVRRHERRLGPLARPRGRGGHPDAPRLQPVSSTPEKLLLAAPRGYCAGVDRAVQTVERALELHGPPVYVRKEIVHNKHVVESLRERGAIFVDELEDAIPEGAITVFSAHGVSPAVHADAERRGLQTIDATCPLVTKVHREAVKFAAEGYTIVLIGHAGHEEVEGTTGEAPEHIVLVQTEEDVDALEVPDPDRGRLHLPDHAVGRRDALDHQPAARALPEHHRAAHRRHLLRDHQPPVGGEADGRAVRSRARHRLDELVELPAPGRRRARLRRPRAPDRQRVAGAGGVARGRPTSSASRPAPARPRSSSSASSRSSATAGPSRSRTSRSCARTCASCCRRSIRQQMAARPKPRLISVAVLVEPRRRPADRRALAVEAQRRGDERDAVGGVDRLHAELGGQRERLVDAVDRADRHACRAQHLAPSGRPAGCGTRR